MDKFGEVFIKWLQEQNHATVSIVHKILIKKRVTLKPYKK